MENIKFDEAMRLLSRLASNEGGFGEEEFFGIYRQNNKSVAKYRMRNFLIKLVSDGYLIFNGEKFEFASKLVDNPIHVINSAVFFCKKDDFISALIESIGGDS